MRSGAWGTHCARSRIRAAARPCCWKANCASWRRRRARSRDVSRRQSRASRRAKAICSARWRSAYGQGQMETIVRDALPFAIYEFQATLSNNNRPDCLIRLPGSKTAIVIDSKFPLEAFEVLKNAITDSDKRVAEARVRADVGRHVKDIAEKYIIEGETQPPAIMFVPSESLYAELHDTFSDVIQKAHRSQVIVVSPNILLLAINTIQTVMKDARMRDQANLIQREVGLLLNDVRLLADRVGKLQSHLDQAEGDIKNILISAGKVVGRAEKIERVELNSPETEQLSAAK